MNIITSSVRDFFLQTDFCWSDISRVLLEVKDMGRLQKLLAKYFDIHRYIYNEFLYTQYPDGLPNEFTTLLKHSTRSHGDISWSAICYNLRAVRFVECYIEGGVWIINKSK